MIITKITGGLGNQMFQYALGRRLSLERHVPLKLDISFFGGQKKRAFELDQFNIPDNLKLPDYWYRLPPFTNNSNIRRLYNKIDSRLPKKLKFVYNEANPGNFEDGILKANNSSYIKGYWQTEKYFDTIKDQIRKDFTPRQPLSAQDQALADEIWTNPKSVSVHIRRGDYVSNWMIMRRHYVCTPDYYNETMRLMKDKLGQGVIFYVFSDDPDWCSTGVDYPSDFRIVSDRKRSASHELIMMSRCRHAIMANSSFSWWGAWLKEDPDKKVIFPARWSYDYNAPDIPLTNWLAWQHNTRNDWKYIDIPFAKSLYKSNFKAELNLDEPRRFTEKIQWLKIYDHKPLYTLLADKLAVRNYVADKVGSQYLTRLFGTYENSSEIEWDTLPGKFVLKVNHGSNWNIICKNKDQLNIEAACQKLDHWMGKNFYYEGREWQYKDIPPRIMCEEFLEGDKEFGLLDYKIWCFNGQPKYIDVITDRFIAAKRAIFDLNWQKLAVPFTLPPIDRDIPRPEQLGEMLKIAGTLSQGIPFVRVDLYNYGGKIIFGELTLTPRGGFQIIYPPEFDFKWGNELILPR